MARGMGCAVAWLERRSWIYEMGLAISEGDGDQFDAIVKAATDIGLRNGLNRRMGGLSIVAKANTVPL